MALKRWPAKPMIRLMRRIAPRRVLVVDDEPVVCQSIEMVLASDGHETESAQSGTEALNRMSAKSFDLVLVDFQMPGMKGDELAQTIKALYSSMPVIMVTAFPPSHQVAGVDRLVLKPFTIESLRRAMAEVLAETAYMELD